MCMSSPVKSCNECTTMFHASAVINFLLLTSQNVPMGRLVLDVLSSAPARMVAPAMWWTVPVIAQRGIMV